VDEGELSMPLSSQSAVDAKYPGDSCCLLQDVVEISRQKSGMLQGYSDAVLQAEALEEQLVMARKHSAMLQSKLDGTFAQYHNEVQDMQAKSNELVRKNKSLRNKNKGTCCRVEYPSEVPCSSLTHLACYLQSLRLMSSS
jgi:FtsZ-binding cell division protein ZapB